MMKKINKFLQVIVILFILVVLYILYVLYIYEDTRWNASVNLSPEDLKIYRENLNK